MFSFLTLATLLLAQASAVNPTEGGRGCTDPILPTLPKVPVMPAPGVKAADIAAATNPITVGTFLVKGNEYKLQCKGERDSLRCGAVTQGQAAIPACIAGVHDDQVQFAMAAMNMEFLALVPLPVFAWGKPWETIVPEDPDDAK